MSSALISAIMLACFGGAGAIPAAAQTPVAARTVLAEPAATLPPRNAAIPAPKESPKPVVFAGLPDATVVERVRAAIEAITTLEADFSQTAPSGAISTGKFYLRRPGLLRFEFEPPSPLLIVATGGTVFVKDEALGTTDSYPVSKTPLKYLLKKRVELKGAKVVSVDRGTETVAVTFASDEDETDSALTVVMRAPDLQLKEWIVRDPKNGVTQVALSNVAMGKALANRLFAAPETDSAFLKD